MTDAAYTERLERLRQDAAGRVEASCQCCGGNLRKSAPQLVGPGPTTTSWEHADGRGIWCDGSSSRYADAIEHPANPDMRWLLEQLTARDTLVAKMGAAIRETQRLASAWRQDGAGYDIVVRPLSGSWS